MVNSDGDPEMASSDGDPEMASSDGDPDDDPDDDPEMASSGVGYLCTFLVIDNNLQIPKKEMRAAPNWIDGIDPVRTLRGYGTHQF